MTETNTGSAASGSFAALFGSSERTFKEGEIAKGRVLSIDDEWIQIDIGFKSEGMIAAWEFMTARSSCPRRRPRVKGGLAVDIGVKAFLPGSQVDLRPVRNLDAHRRGLRLQVIKFNKKRGNIVLSRRVLLRRRTRRQEAADSREARRGKILTGVVKNITDYGAFVDLGGIDGLLHITDMSWGRINHPEESVQGRRRARGHRPQVRPRRRARLAWPQAAQGRPLGPP
jgi:small subunit ribosomal protein S1